MDRRVVNVGRLCGRVKQVLTAMGSGITWLLHLTSKCWERVHLQSWGFIMLTIILMCVCLICLWRSSATTKLALMGPVSVSSASISIGGSVSRGCASVAVAGRVDLL